MGESRVCAVMGAFGGVRLHVNANANTRMRICILILVFVVKVT